MSKPTKSDSPTKLCTFDGCVRALRARGLCSSHYNARHQPSRHVKKLVPCASCGTEVLKGTGGGRKYGAVCSEECRMQLQAKGLSERTPTKCDLPKDHPVLWIGKSSAWPRYGWKACEQCAQDFPSKTPMAKYCSRKCSGLWSDRARGIRSAADIMAEVRQCGRCDGEYRHRSPQRVHCSDLCRDLDREDRCAKLYHGWISKARRTSLYERDNYTCWLCDEPCDMEADPQRDPKAPTLDHLTPRSKGGSHESSNLRTACRSCNSRRQDMDATEYKSSMLELACG